MKISKLLAGCTLTLAVAGLLSPQMVLAADPSSPNIARPAASVISDVALHDNGVLVGQVVNKQGVPQSGTLVRVVYQGEPVATAQADKDGRFSVSGLRGGVHTVETADSGGIYRLWAPRTAPPAAASGILLVKDELAQRGQILSCNARRYMWGAIGGAGIAGGIIAITDHNPTGS
jgi:hypothetical protein